MWEAGFGTVILPTVSTLVVFVITVNLVKYLMCDSHLQLRDVSKEHNWTTIAGNNKAHYCSICEALILNMDGVVCDSCGVCSDRGCIKIADKSLKCKAITLSHDEPMKHHWVKGNLPPLAMCEVCDDECDAEVGLVNYSCCWCQRSVHESCVSRISSECDFGEFKLMIIPPGSLEVVNKRSTMRRRLRLRSIVPPVWPNWKPLIIVANRKSGNNDGATILSMFRRLVNPAQVVDLSERDPVAALEWCRLLGENPCKVLVAGGDGTVAWLLNAIHKLRLKPVPSVAILPLGTGNDLSRVLGWGKGYCSDLEATEILHRVQTAQPVKLDRWAVTIKPDTRSLGFRGSQQRLFMYNYMSVGVDAQVTLNFHRTRESRFYIFSHRIFNKLLYLGFGTQQVVERECKDLDKRIEVYLDGKQIELPSIESIVILNIPYWGAGVKLWDMGLEGTEGVGVQSISDGKLEVVAIYSSFHIAQLQVGLSQPHRLGQAHTVKVRLLDSCAVQIDGEPWHQNPCEFIITYCNQASMLRCFE
ncbi:diacylglycerol kinase epsilon [Venturia canescens]|uniref:diacylglycerol kinase epsilon n=1 Tax=Venturia canescens TaxID=32260 RepID=UPI001C9BC507|nr:diacylglycerol kinase epsilon [Venturia canescens]XP_043281429.1 diacylglycerol kinase epsilon [Venturia canescens]